MVEYRKTNKEDIKGILDLYKECFGIDVDADYYDYLNKNESDYFSMVALDGGKVIAHNSIIKNSYKYDGENIIVGVSSGGMVSADYSGVFYTLLKKQFALFNGDVIIAFPNKNSEPFFTKLFRFNIIQSNFYNLSKKDFNKINVTDVSSVLDRSKDFILKRIDHHPKNSYKKIEDGNSLFIYKEYQEEIDIMFCSDFGVFFTQTISSLINKGYDSFNIVHWDSDFVEQIGFKPKKNNIFVYKSFNNKEILFQPQMIDSDVF